MASVIFAGAAGEVTGSRHLIEINGKNLLLDCGMFQGHRKDAEDKNREFFFKPSDVDALILSHGHLDHCGVIPRLVKLGFKGKIFCTAATAELALLILEDSARIQEQDAAFYAKKNFGRKIQPLYTGDDVANCRERFAPVAYGVLFEPLPGVKAWLHEAGHILGSAEVSLKWDGGSLIFSGDLGRPKTPLLRDPFQPHDAPAALIMESTYGDRLHENMDGATGHLAEAVKATAARGGRVIIPAFAVGRAQELIYELAGLRARKLIPEITVFVDSPMASRATRLFEKHKAILDDEFQAESRRYDPFNLPWIQHTEDVQDSKAINGFRGPCVIISASGMCESGRILHHLRNNIEDPKNMVLMVGFQAEGTLGRRLVDGQKQVLIYGERFEVKAEVRMMNEYSAHADYGDLLTWLKGLGKPAKVFLVHGEASASLALKGKIAQTLGIQAVIPALGASHEL